MRKMCVLFTVVLGLLALPAAANALNFEQAPGSPVQVPVPDSPNAVITDTAVGNFNGDIYDDIAAVGQGNTLYVWLTQADGTFQAAPGSPYTTNMDALEKDSIHAVDMTADFRDDLIIQSPSYAAPGSSAAFYTFFANGNGSFPTSYDGTGIVNHTGPPNYRGPAYTKSVTVADVTDDGCPDLIVGMFERSFQIEISNCAGGFTPATPAPVQVTTPLSGAFDGFTSTAAGDYNGDGDVDIALMLRAHSSAAGPRIVYVLEGDGSGLFGAPLAVYDVAGEDNSFLLDIETIDQNGDAFDDLLVLAQNQDNSDTVTSLLGSGSGLVANPAGELTDPYRGIFTLTTADFDDDGAQDVAAALRGSQQFNVALGDGVDSFLWDGPWDFPQIGDINFFPNDLETPDINGDNFPDVVSSSSHSSDLNQARGIDVLISRPEVSADLEVIDFPETAVGEESPAQTVTLSVGPGPSAGFINSDFSIEGPGDINYNLETDCPGTVTAGETCDVNVTFAPDVDGQHNPDLKIKTPDGSTITIPLSGVTGHEDLAVNTPDGTTFEIPGGSGSGEFTFEVESTGTWPVEVTDIQVYPDLNDTADRWSVIDTNNCKTTLEPGETCEFDVSFNPKLEDTGSTLLSYLVLESTNNDLSDVYAELNGKATTSAFEVTPLGLEFGERAIGSGPSPIQQFTISPTGDGPVPFYSVELEGDDASSFTITDIDDCPNMIPADSDCTFGVSFNPQGEPRFIGTTNVAIHAYNNNGGDYSVNLTGTAVSAEPPPPGPEADLRLKVKSARKVKGGKKLVVTATVRNAGDAATIGPVLLRATAPKKATRPVKTVKIPSVLIGGTVVRKFRIPVRKNAKGKFRVKVNLTHDGISLTKLSVQTGVVKIQKVKKRR